jgi:hypothetical protein
MQETYLNEDEDDILEGVNTVDYSSVVYSRDWTVETFISQIRHENIDLNPKFQRRNAWDDVKRSRLIESLIIGIPVPEIVLAEEDSVPKSFIVIDGKQRLLTIAGFVMPETYQFWNNYKLKQLKVSRDLNGMSYDKLETERFDEYRLFLNANLRCTIISNYKSNDVLYDTFYRLNTGSVPLNTQELRQFLHKGEFANYLLEITNELQPIHQVLGLSEPDERLNDIEIILRFISLVMFGQQDYQGNLKVFLDNSMAKITQAWPLYEDKVKQLYQSFNEAIEKLSQILPVQKIGRLFPGEKPSRFNKVLFEVQVYYLCNDSTFRTSLESSTQSMARYRVRFELFGTLINSTFHKELKHIPIKKS